MNNAIEFINTLLYLVLALLVEKVIQCHSLNIVFILHFHLKPFVYCKQSWQSLSTALMLDVKFSPSEVKTTFVNGDTFRRVLDETNE